MTRRAHRRERQPARSSPALGIAACQHAGDRRARPAAASRRRGPVARAPSCSRGASRWRARVAPSCRVQRSGGGLAQLLDGERIDAGQDVVEAEGGDDGGEVVRRDGDIVGVQRVEDIRCERRLHRQRPVGHARIQPGAEVGRGAGGDGEEIGQERVEVEHDAAIVARRRVVEQDCREPRCARHRPAVYRTRAGSAARCGWGSPAEARV